MHPLLKIPKMLNSCMNLPKLVLHSSKFLSNSFNITSTSAVKINVIIPVTIKKNPKLIILLTIDGALGLRFIKKSLSVTNISFSFRTVRKTLIFPLIQVTSTFLLLIVHIFPNWYSP